VSRYAAAIPGLIAAGLLVVRRGRIPRRLPRAPASIAALFAMMAVLASIASPYAE
jgi:hypothetical protein